LSKTTEKYGKPLYTISLSNEVNPKPTKKLLNQWAKLDAYARKEYGKCYDNLDDKQKSTLHFNINMGVYKEV
jgi:hypothetical protein